MPKVQVCLTAFSQEVFDQSRAWPPGLISVKRSGSDISLRLPLEILGNPDRVFTGARTYLHELPLDSAPWRVLFLNASEEESAAAAGGE
jgi:hypothetical protein